MKGYNGAVKLYMPHEKWESKLLEYGVIRTKKYFRDGRFTVIYKTKSGMKESVFYRGPFIRKDKPNVPQADVLPAYIAV